MKTTHKYLLTGLLAGLAAGLFFYRADLMPAGSARAQAGGREPAHASAEQVQEAFRSVSAQVLPGIVEVKTEQQVDLSDGAEIPWDDFFQQPGEDAPRFYQSQGLGSGVIIERNRNDYYIVTNAHVVGEAEDITVKLNNGETVDAQLTGKDERKDLALLKITYAGNDIAVVRQGDSDRLYIGDWVLAFGSPYGYGQSVSSGIVSALGRKNGPGGNISDFIQTDASINQGNSGGALVNIRGELVGINTFIVTPNGGSIGIGFAVPVNNIKNTFRQLIDSGEISYGWLGASLVYYSPDDAESLGYEPGQGVLVSQIFNGSPADQAELKPGDLITALDGEPVTDRDRFIYMIGDRRPGEQVRFSVSRLGDQMEIPVRIGQRGDEDGIRQMHTQAFPGFVPVHLTGPIRSSMDLPDDLNGVLIVDVYPGTSAQSADLRAGDIITSVDGQTVQTLEDLYGVLTSDSDYSVYRNGELLER